MFIYKMMAVHKDHTKDEISTEDYQKLGGEISKKIDALDRKARDECEDKVRKNGILLDI